MAQVTIPYQAIQQRLTRLCCLWVLGEAWFTLLVVGAVGVLLWAR